MWSSFVEIPVLTFPQIFMGLYVDFLNSLYVTHLSERAFFQQKLPAWEPVMTADWGAGIFLVMGIVALAVGIPLVLASNSVR